MGIEVEQGACGLLSLTCPELCGIGNRKPAMVPDKDHG